MLKVKLLDASDAENAHVFLKPDLVQGLKDLFSRN